MYDVIYSAGLFDYFSDSVARPAALMMFALDWFLIYRDEGTLEKLYSGIANSLTIESEPEGVNLSALLRKQE